MKKLFRKLSIGLLLFVGNGIIPVIYAEIQTEPEGQFLKPPFGHTASTVFDIIRSSDLSTLACMRDNGRGRRQIWDKRVEDEPIVDAFLFLAYYTDGSEIEIAINPEFETLEVAREEALRFAAPIGQLPNTLRAGISKLSIHKGSKGFHAGDEQIIGYSGTADQRLSYDHLEETLFHESVHASWDAEHRLSAGWKQAQAADGRFLTRYAQKSPEREDLAETALFAYAISHYPERFPPVDTQVTIEAVPARIEYIRALLPPGILQTYGTLDTIPACTQ